MDAAAEAGEGAIAYLPRGNYQICDPIIAHVGRGNWTLSGSGYTSKISFEPRSWPTPADPTAGV